MKEIRGDAKNIRSLLSGAKYAIDYYQREYRWGRGKLRQVRQMPWQCWFWRGWRGFADSLHVAPRVSQLSERDFQTGVVFP